MSNDPLFADEQDGPTLGFEAWMDLSTQLLRRSESERAAILERAHVQAADWEASDAHWTGALVDDISRGDTTRAEAYGARCAAELRQRAAAPQPEDAASEAPSREPALPAPNQDAAVVQAFEAKAPPRAELPAPVEPAAAFAPASLPDVRLPLGPAHIPEASPREVPAAAEPSQPSFAEPPKPSFVEPPKPSFVAFAAQAPEPLGKAPHPGNMTLDALPVPAELKPLPFAPRPAGAAPVLPPPEPAPGPAARKPQSPLGETAMALDLPIGPAMPFAGASPTPPKREVVDAGGMDLPVITVEQYAALCAELSLGKSTLERALARQGIHDATVWSALDRSWQDRFRSDPELRRRWTDLTAQYREFLKNHAL